eukprot:m.147064 g.147064  ORF g.147064 m.147064 type:complete len:315 (+) comp30516_c0_seq3:187-1131(+)
MRYPPHNEAEPPRSRGANNMYQTEYSSNYRATSNTASSHQQSQPPSQARSTTRTRNDDANLRRAATNTVNDPAGYNSDDEHTRAGPEKNALYQDDESFIRALKQHRGWQVERMQEDGACMFRAVAFHLYGDQDMHGTVRDQCMDYMSRNRDHFVDFVTEDFTTYITRKRNDRCYGNHLELQAMSELYNRNIEVYAYDLEPIRTVMAQGDNHNAPIRMSYHGNIHYNAICDPMRPSFGVGLGFSGLKPGDADKSQLNQAKTMSEQAIIEQELMQSSLRQSEDDLLMQQIEQSVLAESQREYWNNLQQQRHSGNNS